MSAAAVAAAATTIQKEATEAIRPDKIPDFRRKVIDWYLDFRKDERRRLVITLALGLGAYYLAKRVEKARAQKGHHTSTSQSKRARQLEAYELLPQPTSLRVRAFALAGVLIASRSFEIFSEKMMGRGARKLIPNIPIVSDFAKVPVPLFRLINILVLWICTLTSNPHQPWPYLLAFFLPLEAFLCAVNGMFYHHLFSIFIGGPLLELFTGVDRSNPTEAEAIELNKNVLFRLIPMAWVPLQLALIGWACWAAGQYQFTLPQFLGFVATVGINTGVLGINISHELIHKKNPIEVIFGKILLVTVCYGHWFIEHTLGHHKHVSTPSDPATARKDENFYSFWLRSVSGSFLSAWKLEKERLLKLKQSVWSPRNQFLHLSFFSGLTAYGVYRFFGRRGLAMFFGQSFVAFSLLELINYIEHYGLERKLTDKNRFEPVDIVHSWNADSRITNVVLFKLQRHSDHHAYASRRYQILRSFPESPQMPTGYAGMLTMALCPPLWFKVMNPRLEAFTKRPRPSFSNNALSATPTTTATMSSVPSPTPPPTEEEEP